MNPDYIQTIVQMALVEDIGSGDITTKQLIPRENKIKARLIAKSEGIICGMVIASQVFKALDPSVSIRMLVKDGQRVKKGAILAEISGPTRVLLSGERVALNFLSMLSGIATKTRKFVDAIKPYKTAILDTRKTTPLLRLLERYAVRCGGGMNHRFNLNDMAIIKDNHRVACRGKNLTEVINAFKAEVKAKVIVEVDDVTELKQALMSKADVILLDNMTPLQIKKAIQLRKQLKKSIAFEASGGIHLENVKQYAATGVERVSIGALTHSREALDISLDFLE